LDGKTDAEGGIGGSNEQKDDSSSSSDSGAGTGYWRQPPLGKFFSDDGEDSGPDEDKDGSNGESDFGSEEDESASGDSDLPSSHRLHSQSTENLLEMENDYGLAVSHN